LKESDLLLLLVLMFSRLPNDLDASILPVHLMLSLTAVTAKGTQVSMQHQMPSTAEKKDVE